MQKFILLGVLLIILIGGYVLLFTPAPDAPEEPLQEEPVDTPTQVRASGEVVSVNADEIIFDGPYLITITDTSGQEQVIAIPSMGLPLCAATENITDPSIIEAGDTVSVAGAEDEEGRIVPCDDSEHHLTVTSMVTSEEYGYQFEYPKGPDGYIVLDDEEELGEAYLSGVVLFNRGEYEEFTQSTDAREGPPAMHVRVYENTDNLSAPVWTMQNTLASNYELMIGDEEEAVVGGANATHYTVDGLYPINTYIVAHGGYIYVLMGAYLADTDAIYTDFEALVDSLTFIQTEEQQ